MVIAVRLEILVMAVGCPSGAAHRINYYFLYTLDL